jgi:hypothetical protein
MRYKALATATGSLTNVVWTLVYDASDGYWYPTGATSPLIQFATAGFANSATSTWQDTLTPKLTLPFSGDYSVDSSALCTQSTAGGVSPAMGIIANGIGTPTLFGQITITAVTWPETITAPLPLIGGSAGAILSQAVFTQDATPAHTVWTQRILRVTPIRVR